MLKFTKLRGRGQKIVMAYGFSKPDPHSAETMARGNIIELSKFLDFWLAMFNNYNLFAQYAAV